MVSIRFQIFSGLSDFFLVLLLPLNCGALIYQGTTEFHLSSIYFLECVKMQLVLLSGFNISADDGADSAALGSKNRFFSSNVN